MIVGRELTRQCEWPAMLIPLPGGERNQHRGPHPPTVRCGHRDGLGPWIAPTSPFPRKLEPSFSPGVRWQEARDSRELFSWVPALNLREQGIEYRLTKPNRPWASGQSLSRTGIERVNRTSKDATAKHYTIRATQIRQHQLFIDAYNPWSRDQDIQKSLALSEYFFSFHTNKSTKLFIFPVKGTKISN